MTQAWTPGTQGMALIRFLLELSLEGGNFGQCRGALLLAGLDMLLEVKSLLVGEFVQSNLGLLVAEGNLELVDLSLLDGIAAAALDPESF